MTFFFYHTSASNDQSCLHTKFQNYSTFPSGRKVMTVQRKRTKKLTTENNGHSSLQKPTIVLFSTSGIPLIPHIFNMLSCSSFSTLFTPLCLSVAVPELLYQQHCVFIVLRGGNYSADWRIRNCAGLLLGEIIGAWVTLIRPVT